MTTLPLNKISIGQYLFNVAKLLDVAGNVLIIGFVKFFVPMPPASGNCHYTMSEALDELRNVGSNAACVACKILTVIFGIGKPKGYDHCAQSMDGMPTDITSS